MIVFEIIFEIRIFQIIIPIEMWLSLARRRRRTWSCGCQRCGWATPPRPHPAIDNGWICGRWWINICGRRSCTTTFNVAYIAYHGCGSTVVLATVWSCCSCCLRQVQNRTGRCHTIRGRIRTIRDGRGTIDTCRFTSARWTLLLILELWLMLQLNMLQLMVVVLLLVLQERGFELRMNVKVLLRWWKKYDLWMKVRRVYRMMLQLQLTCSCCCTCCSRRPCRRRLLSFFVILV